MARLGWMCAGCLGFILMSATGCRSGEAVPEAPSTPAPAPKVVLDSSLAGSWYPADPDQLTRDISGYLAQAGSPPLADLKALILPHAGYRYSGGVAAHGLRALGTRVFTRVVILGPSHYHSLVNQVSLPKATHYRTPLGEVPLDVGFMGQMLAHPEFVQVPAAHDREHSVQIEIPLLQHVLGRFELVPLVVGTLDPKTTETVANLLREMVDSDTLVVASTDFTHYGKRFGYLPFEDQIPEGIRALDMGAWEHIQRKDASSFKAYCRETGATICGRNPLGVLLSMLRPDHELTMLNYDQSGRMTHDYGNSVSYLSAAVVTGTPAEPGGRLTPREQEILLKLARDTLTFVFDEGRIPGAEELNVELTPALREVCGAFVSLHRDGALRGCIGDIAGQRPLYQSVMQNAVSAAFRDSRFHPVVEADLPTLDIEISALTPLQPVGSYLDFEPGRHGIVLTKNGRRAVYLPQVAAEQGWTREETLSHLSAKAGLPQNGWRSGARFQIFEALVFGEHEE